MSGRPVAIVTGGRRGIGLGIALALAKRGFDIAVTGITEGEAPEALLATGMRVVSLKSDLSEIEGHAATVETLMDLFGRIDCLVNNAGMASVVRGDFLDLTPGNYDRIMETNLRGTVFFTQAVVRAMLENPPGPHPRSILTISSVSAAMSSPERLDYCMSKAGLASFSKGLALRLAAEDIGVFEIRPGIIATDMTAGVKDKYEARIRDGLVPMGRWGTPGDIGSIAAALAAGEFAFATGSVIEADGGLSISRL